MQGVCIGIDLRAHPLDAQYREVDQQLAHERARHAPVRVARIDAQRVEHRERVGAGELAEVHPRHDDADDVPVQLGDQRYADAGDREDLAQLALEVRAAVDARDTAIDADDGVQVLCPQGTARHPIVRESRVVRLRRHAVVDFGARDEPLFLDRIGPGGRFDLAL